MAKYKVRLRKGNNKKKKKGKRRKKYKREATPVARLEGKTYKYRSTHRLKGVAVQKGEVLERTKCLAYEVLPANGGWHLYTRKKK